MGPEPCAVRTASGDGADSNWIDVVPDQPSSWMTGTDELVIVPKGVPTEVEETKGINRPALPMTTVPRDHAVGTEMFAEVTVTPATVSCPVMFESEIPPGRVAEPEEIVAVVEAPQEPAGGERVAALIVTFTPWPLSCAGWLFRKRGNALQNACGNCPGGNAEMITGIDDVVTRPKLSVTCSCAEPLAGASPVVNEIDERFVAVDVGSVRSVAVHA